MARFGVTLLVFYVVIALALWGAHSIGSHAFPSCAAFADVWHECNPSRR